MKKVILLRGLPASGKSTWAKEQVKKNSGMYKRVNKDALRAMIDCGRWSKDNEKMILKIRNVIILNSLAIGKHVIIDDTNLHEKHENEIRELIKGQAELVIKFFDVEVDEAIKRDSKRENSVGAKVIREMYENFLKPEPPVIEDNPDLPNAIICDVDGTLAHMVNRGPFDWKRVGEDELCKEVYETLRLYAAEGYKIIIVTGRNGVCEKETKEWLAHYGIAYDEFHIRPEGNNEKDSIIKERIYNDHIKGKYNVHFVLDDRPQVCRMWRSLGLFLFQVGDPYIEF